MTSPYLSIYVCMYVCMYVNMTDEKACISGVDITGLYVCMHVMYVNMTDEEACISAVNIFLVCMYVCMCMYVNTTGPNMTYLQVQVHMHMQNNTYIGLYIHRRVCPCTT